MTLFQRPSPGITEDNCRTSALLQRCILVGGVATYVEKRWSSSGVRRLLGRGPTDASSSERVLVAQISGLPIVPNLVNHLYKGMSPPLDKAENSTNRMMEEEHWVCVKVSRRQSVDTRSHL